MYLKKAIDLQIHKFILNHYKVDENIAYYILKQEDLEMLNISRERGSDFVNMLSGIE
jgi:phosphoesterase RecJ-like protein